MSKRLLPLIPAGLTVVRVLPTPDCVTIVARPLAEHACCPDCGAPSRRLHSRYERRMLDLTWQGRPVALHVQARRFRCLAPACPRQTFTERLAGVAALAARRTERLGAVQRCLGFALGGCPGSRLAERLAMPVSADTLRRMVVRAAAEAMPPGTPRVLAVDDWAWKRGHRYGTILVDLERNDVVDLLPDRQAGTLAEWLRRHRGIEVIARDRASAYADGARQGAPDAVQVADRWHMLRNLGDAMRALCDRHGAAARRAARDTPVLMPERTEPDPEPKPVRPTRAQRASAASLARRQARFEEAARLRAAGVPIARIAAQLGAERKTIRRWLALGCAPTWAKPPRRGGVLSAYACHLDRRWAEGCSNAALLWREVSGLGFTGAYSTVRGWARRRRAETVTASDGKARRHMAGEPPSPRQMARLLTAEADAVPEGDRAFLARLLAQAPALGQAAAIAKRLGRLLRREGDDSLYRVLADAVHTQLADFAAGLGRDRAAVQAALDTPWTTSPAEGQINRAKAIKRSMYGRAGFPLLRARVLEAA
ncbi:ISL3 family transposase [Lichenibacterium dinghuense]|uniref:ISL3 family transposase n=1 Tax=Lichenibacterium dinghuense TaxID=2895977 RepID=UPI001F028CEC|nr:ISL3 family transposase [Lichenibacterium sp. 6Y81]